jgi:hypothetical protein
MQYAYLSVFKSPKTGKYRVMIVGQPDNHMMNWRGCNYRRMTLPTPLKRTFTTIQEAEAYRKELEAKNEPMLIKFAAVLGDGAWFPESEMVLVDRFGTVIC